MTNTTTTASETAARAERVEPVPTTMSMRLWGLDWSRILPWRFDDFTVELGTAADGLAFVAEHYASLFETDAAADRFLSDPMTDAKRRFCAEMDVFLMKVGTRTVGIMMAHPSDWTTYYMRTAAVLPEFREKQFLNRLTKATYEHLRAVGVQRSEVECSVTNTAVMRMLPGQGFVITSTSNSERWGALVKFTKFLAPEAQEAFRRQFTALPANEHSKRHQQERRTS